MNISFYAKKAWMRSSGIVKEFFTISKAYSIKYATLSLLDWITFYCHISNVRGRIVKAKGSYLAKYLKENYHDIIYRYKDATESNKQCNAFNLWVFWAQGGVAMPSLVAKCYQQLININRDNSNINKVVLLTMENLHKYIELPEYVYTRLKSGKLQYAHFSDIVRNAIIAKSGGLWVDATVWVSSPVPSTATDSIFYSPHNRKDGTKWCSYALGSNLENSITFSFVRDMLLEICKSGKPWPEYLYQDRLFEFAYNNLPTAKAAIDSAPDNNQQRYMLHALMNSKYDALIYNKITSDTWLFKLSYKALYRSNPQDPTFYDKLLRH